MDLKIALISDELTQVSLNEECQIKVLTPFNYKFILKFWKPDMLLVESCWLGIRGTWKYKIASYKDCLKRNNNKLKLVVTLAKNLNIPTVFWNKEDGVHFNRFIDSAKLFEYVFTTDSLMIDSYKKECSLLKGVKSLPFVVTPSIHYPQECNRINKFCFVGSYRADLHQGRRFNQSMLFDAALKHGLDIYDRNSKRKSKLYRYPEKYLPFVKPSVPYKKTGNLYNNYTACLNINTIVDSPTMYSRRLVEILACKRPVITTNSLAVDSLFKDVVYVVEDSHKAEYYMNEIMQQGTSYYEEKVNYGYELIMKNYTYRQFLERICDTIKLS